ncbi:MAG: hypothetical protein PHQ43_10385 [Dehalococcoidales bacterium]|jgi:hypothetical protein|nr:hypothetical protein [Dehalococcoidales bacterium]
MKVRIVSPTGHASDTRIETETGEMLENVREFRLEGTAGEFNVVHLILINVPVDVAAYVTDIEALSLEGVGNE